MALGNVPPDRTLLEVLREDLGCTGTKEGCGEGDCGACTVVLGEADGHGKLRYSAVNSCIRLAHSIDGMALWTAEDLAEDPLIQPVATSTQPADQTTHHSALHPAQEAMVQCHGSQCGFCTPGFVMSLFGMYQNRVCQGQSISRAQAAQDLSGNLCRCTGYRPILDAAQQMQQLPRVQVDETALLQQLELLALTPQALEADFDLIINATASSLAGDTVPVSAHVLRTGSMAYDMMYGPAAQGFLDWARQHGAVPRDGLGMLVEQAAEAFALWRGVRPPSAQVLKELQATV